MIISLLLVYWNQLLYYTNIWTCWWIFIFHCVGACALHIWHTTAHSAHHCTFGTPLHIQHTTMSRGSVWKWPHIQFLGPCGLCAHLLYASLLSVPLLLSTCYGSDPIFLFSHDRHLGGMSPRVVPCLLYTSGQLPSWLKLWQPGDPWYDGWWSGTSSVFAFQLLINPISDVTEMHPVSCSRVLLYSLHLVTLSIVLVFLDYWWARSLRSCSCPLRTWWLMYH